MNDSRNKVPNSWEAPSLSEVYRIVGGGTPSTQEAKYWTNETKGIPWITSADIKGRNETTVRKYVTEAGIQNSTTHKVPANTLLVVTRVGLGKVFLNKEPICFSQDTHALIQRSELVFSRYSLFFLEYHMSFLKFSGRGTTISGITNRQLKDIFFPLPPFNEQRRIVAKIEELFSEIDKGVESLQTAKAQLQVYRQALLKHAFEGKLTAQWRADNLDKVVPAAQLLSQIKLAREERYQQQLADWKTAVEKWELGGQEGKRPSKPKKPKGLPPLTIEELDCLVELPDGWKWIRVSELGDVQLGRQRSPKNRSKDFPTKYIRAANLTDAGLELFDVLDMEFKPEELPRYLLKYGDVVLSEASGSANQVGKPAVWRNELEKCCFQNTVIRVQPPLEFSDYLFWVFKTYYITGVFSRESGGVGINHLSAGKLASLAIPITSVLEAEKILEIISEKLSVIEHLQETVDTSLRQADAARQSILKKAFSGQLVPQDPTDEPASQLLARIQAEKAAREAQPKSKATKTIRKSRKSL